MLRNHLISHGYPTRTIDQALHQISPVIIHTHHVSSSLFIATAIVLMAIGLGGASFYLFQTPEPSFLLDLETEPITADAEPGSSFFFMTDLVSIGSARRFDVRILHELLDMQNQAIMSKQEEFGIETRASKKSSFLIPETVQPGSYILKTTASYHDGNATASFSFDVKSKVVPRPVPLSASQEQQRPQERQPQEDADYQQQEVPEGQQPEQPASQTDDPFTGLSIFEKLDAIAEIAATNPDLAGTYCQEIADQFYKNQCYMNIAKVVKYEKPCTLITDTRSKDQCFTDVAKLAGQSSLCDSVTFGDARDACLMAFVLRGDYTICGKLQNRYYIDTCGSLAGMDS